MKNWFHSLEARERLTLSMGVIVVVIIILWMFVWSPLRSNTLDLRDTVADKTGLVTDLRRASQYQTTDGQSTTAPSNQSLVVMIDNTGRSFGLAASITRTRPDGPNAINVSFQGAPFDSLISWLIDLEQTYGVSVDTASMTDSSAPGLINGQIALRRN